MIELRTGLPGNGKTLSIVAELASMLAKWDAGSSEARPVFTNIKGLALPVSSIPIGHVTKSKEGTETYIPDWETMPEGSYVIFDEAQDFFPPRSSQSVAPPHVAWLNTHRHKGFDIVVITQHPKLVDPSLRALVGKHRHYRRVFGMNRAIVYEWDGCSDSLSGMKNAVTSYWNFPKNAYSFYKSAEIHTKQKFRLPLWLLIPFVGLLLGAYFVPRAYSTLSSGIQGKGLSSSGENKGTKPPDTGKGGALAPALPASGPAPAPSTLPVATSSPRPAPQYAGCITSETKCQCLDNTGRVIENPPLCRESAQSFGHLVAIAAPQVQPSEAPTRSSDPVPAQSPSASQPRP